MNNTLRKLIHFGLLNENDNIEYKGICLKCGDSILRYGYKDELPKDKYDVCVNCVYDDMANRQAQQGQDTLDNKRRR